ncbi:RUN and SH3 domain-containing protein 1, partial [Balearica regulorum gibbericeps]
QAQLGDSRLSPDVGYLLLHTLCPALYALVEDGLKPFQKDVITGQRKNSPWSVVEASVKTGRCEERSNTRSLHSLCWHVAGLAPLNSARQKFHAFILGLLNIKQLELWISHLQKSPGVISVLYSPMAFFALSQGPLPHLADELLLLIQPLSVLTFHLDLLFEHHHLSVDVRPLSPARGLVPGPQVGAALQQTFQHVLRWGDQLSRALLGADSSQETHKPETGPQDAEAGLIGWWGQLSQASRIYAAPSKEKFPFVWWTKLRTATGDSRNQAAPSTPEPSSPGPDKGSWLGRLFGATSPSARSFPPRPDTISTRSRRPSSWLSPSTRVLAVMVKGLASEKTRDQEQPERNVSDTSQTPRAVRALCDHTGTADGHLSFQKGDILQLLSTVDEDWIHCCHGNSTGLVPVSYTSLIL